MVRTGIFKAAGLTTRNDSSPAEVKVDDQFVVSLEEAKAKMERLLSDRMREGKRADYNPARTLPEEDDMDQILRYDRAVQKKFDWAQQKLLESQHRRRRAQEPASISV